MSDQAAFEAWAYVRDFDLTKADPPRRGPYANERTAGAWSAWLHCTAAERAEAEADAVDALIADGWVWDGDQWKRPPRASAPCNHWPGQPRCEWCDLGCAAIERAKEKT